MPQRDLVEHRKRIAAIVDIELDGYFRPDMGEGRRAMLLARWCDELQDWPAESIRAAMAKWCRDQPRTRPNYGDILGLLRAAWGEKHAPAVRAAMAATQEAPREPISAERANAILAELGFAVKRVEPPRNCATAAEIERHIQELQDRPEAEP
ncbi:MAG: hypothetical protein MEQ74_11970 [Paracoccus sp.]|nr:hypothetical protein [Paracoccus sp. (in: a-proteobacteria)]